MEWLYLHVLKYCSVYSEAVPLTMAGLMAPDRSVTR